MAPDGLVESRTLSARLKLELLYHGVRIGQAASAAIEQRGKAPARVRSGACGGLDVILDGGVFVNVPVAEPFALASPLELVAEEDRLRLRRSDHGIGDAATLDLIPAPAYYTSPSAPGARRIGQLCFDRLGVGLTNLCVFWRGSDRRCKFCSIGLNLDAEDRQKALGDILQVVDLAFGDQRSPARHLLLGGGTPAGDDAGGDAMASVAQAVKDRWPDRSIYAMLTAPQDLAVLDRMARAGIDEIGINLELYDPSAAARHLPGKHREIGRERCLAALERAVEVVGPVNARSILLVGLEPVEHTLAGVEALASRGVMPILSPFRPLVGTELEKHPRPTPQAMWDLALDASDVAGSHGIPIGPTCRPCQANTITPPDHPSYRPY